MPADEYRVFSFALEGNCWFVKMVNWHTTAGKQGLYLPPVNFFIIH
jgi:hypothetical protein